MVKIYKRVHFFCLFAFVFCQTGIPATGKVVNIRTGVGIVGVDLTIINSNIGTVTDTAGFFNLEWTDHYPIRIQASHIGYEMRTIVVLKPGNIWIGLNPAVLKGEEVIVVGDRSYSEKEVSSGEESINLTEVNILFFPYQSSP